MLDITFLTFEIVENTSIESNKDCYIKSTTKELRESPFLDANCLY